MVSVCGMQIRVNYPSLGCNTAPPTPISAVPGSTAQVNRPQVKNLQHLVVRNGERWREWGQMFAYVVWGRGFTNPAS